MGNDKTKWIFDEFDEDTGKQDRTTPPEMTETLGNDGGSRDQTFVGSDDPTVMVPGGDQQAAKAPEKTQIYTRGNAGQFDATAQFDTESDPVTGWLVVVRGPGLGVSIPLGAGMNTIGRGSGARASLPFGDTLISSDDHARIIYDDADRKFYIAHGSGKNISRMNGQLLSNMVELPDGAAIDLSRVTRVVFCQFCGEGFDWSDIETEA